MWLAFKPIKNAQITLQLAKIRRFEFSFLQLNGNKTVQSPVEE